MLKCDHCKKRLKAGSLVYIDAGGILEKKFAKTTKKSGAYCTSCIEKAFSPFSRKVLFCGYKNNILGKSHYILSYAKAYLFDYRHYLKNFRKVSPFYEQSFTDYWNQCMCDMSYNNYGLYKSHLLEEDTVG